jgi:hypothetical protein
VVVLDPAQAEAKKTREIQRRVTAEAPMTFGVGLRRGFGVELVGNGKDRQCI